MRVRHDHQDGAENLVALDQGAGLIAVQPGHHDIDEDDVGPVVSYLGEGVEAVHRGIDRATLLGKQGLRRAPDGLAVIDHEHFQPVQRGSGVIRHRVLQAGRTNVPRTINF